MRWELVALRLAQEAGLDVPVADLHLVDGKPVLVVDRFDRAGSGRIGYVSAMTMLEATDGEQASYLEIADAIERHSPSSERDLRELWRRIAFSILVSNTDNHLRNHGFLRTTSAGWSLAPAFDINPNPAPGTRYLSTAIDFDDASASIETLMAVAEAFRIDEATAHQILSEVGSATDGWRKEATAAGLPEAEIALMAPAFEHDQADLARRLGASPGQRQA